MSMPCSAWPSWLTDQQIRRIPGLAGYRFVWRTRTDPAGGPPAVYGLWDRNREEEINVALRAAPDRSFVGIYPRGTGFWHGDREPVMADATSAGTGVVDDMLDLAEACAKNREPHR